MSEAIKDLDSSPARGKAPGSLVSSVTLFVVDLSVPSDRYEMTTRSDVF